MYVSIYKVYIITYTLCVCIFYVVPPPVITDPPVPQEILALQNATFTCIVTGYKVKYHWINVSGSIPSRAIGISSYRLTIVNIIPSDNAAYKCVVTNEGGSVESDAVELRVIGMYDNLDHYQ